MRTLVHIDADPLWRGEIKRATGGLAEVRQIGFAATGSDGLALCQRVTPSIALLDLALPDMDGFAFAERLAQLSPPPRPQIIFLTSRCDDVALHRIERGPFAGLVWKTVRYAEELGHALHAAAFGRQWFPREALERMRQLRGSPGAFFKILSPTELHLMPRFASGETDTTIAASTGLAEATVRWHRYRIMRKVGVCRSVDFVRWAGEAGFALRSLPAPPCVVAL